MNKIVPDPPLNSLNTAAHACTSLFGINSGIGARDALTQVSLLLKGAELNADDIGSRLSGFEAEQLWRITHGVELARGVVDALLADQPPA
ncbi:MULTISPECIES: hypothetical protein [unclassified Pseudomonas]|uniref:hypothetical protein n=1 Tax=unclassified Pseudomonas TaxID=196821 RepID=UPI001295B0DE|nr:MULTISPECIES: hypothetical protein [unclassified Pseudomonas]MDU7556844.1 hypothetical protein [Pseudomonas sp.]MQT43188.1 hypothetical protein [Pseudomonas sp. FSL R10-0765]MQT53351.1 hypothetical protein [Pseudomonas sp. FSL R10-2398]MQU01359.1 hypothetical protein [Pseudomonas sp. FSL R10-2245]MQU14093.1 hypothetical protein [Pseudomonas sp. FSL R10-2189]